VYAPVLFLGGLIHGAVTLPAASCCPYATLPTRHTLAATFAAAAAVIDSVHFPAWMYQAGRDLQPSSSHWVGIMSGDCSR
jgi:hypothetical protein